MFSTGKGDSNGSGERRAQGRIRESYGLPITRYLNFNVDYTIFYKEKACGVGVLVINEAGECALVLENYG